MPEEYTVSIMTAVAEDKPPAEFRQIVDEAADSIRELLAEEMKLAVNVFDFVGPHLTPTRGAYAPMDYLELGMSEKVERQIHFLLIVTEVDLAASTRSYVLALPSQLTNIGIVSTKRLSPAFWGHEADSQLTRQRLTGLLLHTFGHLLNLSHHDSSRNIMYDFETMEDLAQMTEITPQQRETIKRNLPREAREAVALQGRWSFALRQVADNLGSILRHVARAHPLRLILKLPTMLTAALSVVIVIFFSAEAWDVASTLSLGALLVFSAIAIAVATALLYRAFEVGPSQNRQNLLAESVVVTAATTLFSLLLTVLLIYLLFFLLVLVSAVTFFPAQLKETWPTVDPAVRLTEHVKLGLFLGSLAVLTGSLGGRADNQSVVRHVLFLNEEA
ncbi:MAG: hypothetical protein ACOCXI_11200 [Chloroflexota bacterium]